MDAVSQTTFSNVFFLKENILIPIKISLKFVPKGPINNTPALVQKMAWRRLGDKPLYEPMLVSLLTYASLGFNELMTRCTVWPFNKMTTAAVFSFVNMLLFTEMVQSSAALVAQLSHGRRKMVAM